MWIFENAVKCENIILILQRKTGDLKARIAAYKLS